MNFCRHDQFGLKVVIDKIFLLDVTFLQRFVNYKNFLAIVRFKAMKIVYNKVSESSERNFKQWLQKSQESLQIYY